jgi:succinyl-CoA synthetase beta subunit
MKLFEFESKRIFNAENIPVAKGDVVSSCEEARRTAASVGLPVVLKAQVPVGRRAKAGGVRVAENLEEVVEVAHDLFASRVAGFHVHKILVEQHLPILKELYLGITINDSVGKFVILASSEGGTEIEKIAANAPQKIVSLEVDPLLGFEQYEARRLVRGIGLAGDMMLGVSNVLWLLYQVFVKYDATIAEINPLIITESGEVYAAGAVLSIDDDALDRHKDLIEETREIGERIEDDIEREAAQQGIAYVRLGGDIAVIGSGAGLAMATVDLIKDYGGEPANFLDTGGRITRDHVWKCLSIVMKNPRVAGVLVNMYGGINPMVEAAHGIVEFVDERRPRSPIVVKLRGNSEEEAWTILEKAGIHVVRATQTEDAVRLIVALSRESSS